MASPDNIEGISAALARPHYVPKGITAAFLLENRDRPAIVATLFTAALATLVVALRCYARIVIVRKFGLDDRLALLTLVSQTFSMDSLNDMEIGSILGFCCFMYSTDPFGIWTTPGLHSICA
jgi:hypothetical protein